MMPLTMTQDTRRILVVDDEVAICQVIQDYLSLRQYDVATAGNYDEALRQLEIRTFDVILSDIRMPGKSGIELITQIMGERKDIPIIINTAYQSYKDDFMTWAADAYVVKSSSLDELKSKIKELLSK